MIGGEDGDDRLGIPPVHVGRGQDERGGRVPGARLDQDVGRRQGRQQPADDPRLRSIGDRKDAPAGDDPADPPVRFLDHRLFGDDGKELLGPALPAERPKAGAAPPGHDDGVKIDGGFHDGRSSLWIARSTEALISR